MSRLSIAMFRAAMVWCILLTTSGQSQGSLPTVDDFPKYRIGEMEKSIGFYQAIEMDEDSLLFSKQSKYQNIEVHQSKHYGKILVLDGVIQLTERDADSYNEMMAHIPMFQHSKPKRVLIIGGGDGYVLKEVCTLVGLQNKMTSVSNVSPYISLFFSSMKHRC